MKPINLKLLAAVAAAGLTTESSDAFTPNLFATSRGERIRSSNAPMVLQSSPFDSAAPNDQVIQEEYSKWRQKYGKGEFDSVRYQNFKANFMAVTVRNNMERTRARQNGEAAPSPIALNEYGDCSADEYRMAMGQQQQQQFSGSGPRRVAPSAKPQNNGLQPTNAIINTSSQSSSSSNTRTTRSPDLANASQQLRAAVQQRTSMEKELAEMKQLLEEKKKLLQKATKDEQDCNERLQLREEQKRLLSERLNNGWEDERGMNNNYY